MVRQSLLALVLAGLICSVSAAVAQDNGSANNGQQAAPAGPPPEHGHHEFSPERRTERLTRELKLTSDQQSKVLDILKSDQSQMESLRSDTSTSQEDKRAKMMEIHKTSNDQIRALLDGNQQKKWDNMQSRREQWREHPPEGQAPNGSQPPQQQ